jgi:hypothetical protein
MAVFSAFAHRRAQNFPANARFGLIGQSSIPRKIDKRRGGITAFTRALTAASRRSSWGEDIRRTSPIPTVVPANAARSAAKNAFYRQNSRPALASVLCDGALLNIWGRKSSISIGNLHHY